MSADQTPAADPTPGSSRVDVAGLRARAQKFDIVRVLAQAYGFCTCSRAQTRRGGHGTGCPWVDGGRLDHLARALDEATIPPAPVLALLAERDDLAARLATAKAAVRDLTEAIRLTIEYTDLPPIDGWSWYDALRKHAPDLAAWMHADYHRRHAPDLALDPDAPTGHDGHGDPDTHRGDTEAGA